jgi:hypothetical protein
MVMRSIGVLILTIFLSSCGVGICSSGADGKCSVTVAGCPAIVPGNATLLSGALTTIATALAAADSISNTQLTVPGDSQSFTTASLSVDVFRNLPSAFSGSFSVEAYTASIAVPAAVFAGSPATNIDEDVFRYPTNILSKFYAPSPIWNSPLFAYRLVDSSAAATQLPSLSQRGNPVSVSLPCDKSRCTVACTCRCYRWDFTVSRWTQNGVTTTPGNQTASCESYLPAAYLSVFAVQNGCE